MLQLETVPPAEFGDQPSFKIPGRNLISVGTEFGRIQTPDSISGNRHYKIVKIIRFIIQIFSRPLGDSPKEYRVHVFVKRKVLFFGPSRHPNRLFDRSVKSGAVGAGIRLASAGL